ncbi:MULTISPECIES: type II toxin-antitoxin system PemK/MazF family toxin [Pannonibacter]|uniref:type II toxin-antitoxin system PemK/MazF family toxin n=1 Tax=Pannonibacter TaxID=227873 RepID=UPI0018E556D6|nr:MULTISPECIES: type II toxin-antitoxin system PemK/MazF family toxin [Pannonibacter]MCY1707762.1 type II toxin-antitoxin system PemK/MazF family toxin [Pannonibacter sp. SL95]
MSARPDLDAYCPERFDIIWISFDPQQGREQSKRRPALVLSPRRYNTLTRLCVLCPITSQIKGYPFEVALPAGALTSGAVLSDQIKSFDWSARAAAYIESCPQIGPEIQGKIKALLGLNG